MKALKEKILKEGVAIGTEIVKVDHFLNHRLDVKFLEEIGEEFKKRFEGEEINKILTVEASGIAVACLAAPYFDYAPVVFAKKAAPNTMTEGFYVADETKEISDDSVEEGKVVKTNPPAGAKRSRGTEVVIFVSTGDSKIEIKDYTGQNYLEVRGALQSQGIYVYVTPKEVENPDDYEEGEIIEQSVEPGEKLSTRDSITLYIPDIVTKYPDFTDGSWTEEDVRQFCTEYGVSVEVEYVSSSEDDGLVVYQSRKEGYTVTNGTITIKLYVSSDDILITDTPTDPGTIAIIDGRTTVSTSEWNGKKYSFKVNIWAVQGATAPATGA